MCVCVCVCVCVWVCGWVCVHMFIYVMILITQHIKLIQTYTKILKSPGAIVYFQYLGKRKKIN